MTVETALKRAKEQYVSYAYRADHAVSSVDANYYKKQAETMMVLHDEIVRLQHELLIAVAQRGEWG